MPYKRTLYSYFVTNTIIFIEHYRTYCHNQSYSNHTKFVGDKLWRIKVNLRASNIQAFNPLGDTGTFCSTPCKNAHEVFIQRASQIDSMSKKTPLLGKLIGLIKTLLVLVIFLVVVGVTLHFLKFEVPIISDYMPSPSETVPTEPEEL